MLTITTITVLFFFISSIVLSYKLKKARAEAQDYKRKHNAVRGKLTRRNKRIGRLSKQIIEDFKWNPVR